MTARRTTAIARKLRRAPTDVETILWSRVRDRQLLGFKFRRQMPVGRFVVDFACEQARLVVELDGGQHADNAADDERTLAIEGAGYFLLRFWNNDVTENVEGVLEAIAERLRISWVGPNPSPNPLPAGEGFPRMAS